MPRRRDYSVVAAPRVTERHSRTTGCVRVAHETQWKWKHPYAMASRVTFTDLTKGN